MTSLLSAARVGVVSWVLRAMAVAPMIMERRNLFFQVMLYSLSFRFIAFKVSVFSCNNKVWVAHARSNDVHMR